MTQLLRFADGHTALAVALKAALLAPQARQELIAAGHAEKEVQAMTPVQAFVLDMLEGYDEHRDDLFKWLALPYWQARPGIQQAEARLMAACKNKFSPRVWLPGLLLPAISNVKIVESRTERQLAALRIIEALRAFAAKSGGKLPASLVEIKDVPMPLNPVTGKMFPYRLENQTAILVADGPEDQPQWEYRVKVR